MNNNRPVGYEENRQFNNRQSGSEQQSTQFTPVQFGNQEINIGKTEINTGQIPMKASKVQLERTWDRNSRNKKEDCVKSEKTLRDMFIKYNELKAQTIELKIKKQDAEEKKEKADEKVKRYQVQHYDRTKNIKVTDDDFSTIIAKLGKFSGKLSNFPPNSKSCFKRNLTREEIIDFFIENNQENKEQIQFLFSQDEEKTDYALVSVLVEKLITNEIVNTVYRAPIHLDEKVNDAFRTIERLLLDSQHELWINEFRLKMAKATFDLINYHDKDGKAKAINAKTKEDLIDRIAFQLSKIYDKEEDIRVRIEKLVDMAIELSLPIRGQEDLVAIIDLNSGENVYRNQVKPLYRFFGEKDIILGISPVFLAKSTAEDDTQSINEEDGDDATQSYKIDHTLVYPGKAIY